MLVLAAVCAMAQVDTLAWRQREPTFYYWDNHFADCYSGGITSNYSDRVSVITARRCYIDTTLKVIGIASPVMIRKPSAGSIFHIGDTVMSHRLPEYFQLYEATDSSFDLLAEVRYDTAHPRYRMALPSVWDLDEQWEPLEEYPYVYEAYFDKPYLVRDSFYVAFTTYNNDIFYNESTMQYEGRRYYPTIYYQIAFNPVDGLLSDNFKLKYTNPFDRYCPNFPEDLLYYQQSYRRGWFYSVWSIDFIPIFPIFDTTGLDIHGFRWIGGCDTIRTFHLLYIDSGRAYLSWNAGPKARWWDVSYGPSGTTPERGTKIQQHTSMVCLDSLQGGRRYVVYVRERCRDDTRGPWSDSVSFYMPASSGIQQPEASIVECSTHLIPNPASGPVTVISGFRLEAVEVYTVAGTLVETIGLKANTGVIDTSRWPKGAYILRIRTSHGDTAKRLVVQ